MATYKTEGIIIKRTNFSEADRILTVFSKRCGKIKVLARGVRRITSRRGGNVELFNRAVLFLSEGKTFDILTEAQMTDSFPQLRGGLEKIGQAYCVCELVDRLCAERQANHRVYELLLGFFRNLCLRAPGESDLGEFEINLLESLGFWSERLGKIDTRFYIEEILEGQLKSPKFLGKIGTPPPSFRL